MVLLHGFGCDQSMWRFMVPSFEASHQLLLFDLVGSGGSDLAAYDRDKYGTLHGHADDLIEIISAYAAEPVVFVGHSVSAIIGLLASNQAPQLFASQIMVGPSACYIDDAGYRGGFSRADIDDLLDTMEGNYLGWSSNMAPAIMGAAEQPELGRPVARDLHPCDVGGLRRQQHGNQQLERRAVFQLGFRRRIGRAQAAENFVALSCVHQLRSSVAFICCVRFLRSCAAFMRWIYSGFSFFAASAFSRARSMAAAMMA
eukprot:gene34963-39536_t